MYIGFQLFETICFSQNEILSLFFNELDVDIYKKYGKSIVL